MAIIDPESFERQEPIILALKALPQVFAFNLLMDHSSPRAALFVESFADPETISGAFPSENTCGLSSEGRRTEQLLA